MTVEGHGTEHRAPPFKVGSPCLGCTLLLRAAQRAQRACPERRRGKRRPPPASGNHQPKATERSSNRAHGHALVLRQRAMRVLGTADTASTEGITPPATLSRKACDHPTNQSISKMVCWLQSVDRSVIVKLARCPDRPEAAAAAGLGSQRGHTEGTHRSGVQHRRRHHQAPTVPHDCWPRLLGAALPGQPRGYGRRHAGATAHPPGHGNRPAQAAHATQPNHPHLGQARIVEPCSRPLALITVCTPGLCLVEKP